MTYIVLKAPLNSNQPTNRQHTDNTHFNNDFSMKPHQLAEGLPRRQKNLKIGFMKISQGTLVVAEVVQTPGSLWPAMHLVPIPRSPAGDAPNAVHRPRYAHSSQSFVDRSSSVTVRFVQYTKCIHTPARCRQ